MDDILYQKQIYFNHEEDEAYIYVTDEQNCYIVWLVDAKAGKFILDFHTYDRDKMIEKAVELGKLTIEELLESEIMIKKGKAWAKSKRGIFETPRSVKQ